MEQTTEDRYTKLIEFYRYNPVAFVEDCLGVTPTPQQAELLSAISKKKFVSVKAGHGVGKSASAAMLTYWFLCTRAKPIIVITAPSASQIKGSLWVRVSEYYHKLDPLFRNNFELLSEQVVHREYRHEWQVSARTTRKENASSLQGTHADNLLFIVDEAAGVIDELYETILGSFTQEENYCLMIGNPTRLSGYFYDSHTIPGRWHTMTMSSLDSPLVGQDYIQDMARYGEDHPIYKVRVLGEFPSQEQGTLIDLGVIENAVERKCRAEGPIIWGLDPARFGDDETALAIRQGKKLHKIESLKKADTMEVAGWVMNKYQNLPAEQRPTSIMIDTIGIGAGVYDRLKEQELPVVSVNVAHKSSNSVKWRRLRDELWSEFCDWLVVDEPDIPNDRELIAQASSIRFSYDSEGRLIVEKKDVYKARNPRIGSPDRADAVCLTFYSNKYKELLYIPIN